MKCPKQCFTNLNSYVFGVFCSTVFYYLMHCLLAYMFVISRALYKNYTWWLQIKWNFRTLVVYKRPFFNYHRLCASNKFPLSNVSFEDEANLITCNRASNTRSLAEFCFQHFSICTFSHLNTCISWLFSDGLYMCSI